MSRLFKYFKSVRKELILSVVFILFEVVFEILIPVSLRLLIDEGIEKSNNDLIIRYGVLMIVYAILALIFGILATRNSAKASTEFGRNLRQAQYEKIQAYSFENIDHFSTSSLITRMTMDVNMIQMALNMIIRVAFRAPGILIFSIVSVALFAGPLTWIFISIVPLLFIGFLIILKGAHKHFVKMFEKIDKLNLTIQEDLIGIRTVKSFVREEYEIARFHKDVLDVSNTAKKAEKWVIFNGPLMQFSIGLSFVLISWFASNRIVFHGFTKGEFTNMITYVSQILFSLMLISQVFLMIVMSRASVKRVNEVLDEVPLMTESVDPVLEVKDGSFAFKDVSFNYRGKDDGYVLNNINFAIPSGSFVGIFGATGTGKSTLVQLLSRLYDVSDGEILVGGVNVKDYSLSTLREEVIIVLQKNVLFSGTVRDNIKWGKKDATDEEIILALKKSQAFDFVSKMPKGLDTWIEQGGVNVSGGQRQRLSIARALVANPKILILDDSTSAVDTKTDANIRAALKNEAAAMTKVIISQRLTSLSDADIIIILDNDGIQAIGNHEELYSSNVMYKDVFDTQVKSSEVE